MNWLSKNPFLGALAVTASVVAVAALYFVYSGNSSFTLQKEEYATLTANLRRLQDAKPFPDDANLKLAEAEADRAAALIAEISAALAAQTAPIDESLTPQQFQDKLSAAVESLEEAATTKNVALADDFYLGFEQYRDQPPTAKAAPELGQQLQSIAQAASLLVDARVKSIGGIERQSLPVEAEAGDDGGKDVKSEAEVGLVLAPFDVEFVADQANFRNALGSIIGSDPLLVVRALSVANSQPVPPAKDSQGSAEPVAGSAGESSGIPVLFGQETVTVKMRLASVAGAPTAAEK